MYDIHLEHICIYVIQMQISWDKIFSEQNPYANFHYRLSKQS